MKSFSMDKDASSKELGWFKKHKVWTVIIALIILGGVGSALGGSNKTTNNQATGNSQASTASGKKQALIAKIGEAARDGKFEFTISSIECGKTSVGTNPYLTKQAQGQFCLLNMTVKNIGNEAQSLFSSNQFVFNSVGQKYSADDVATTYAAPEGSTWYSNINPGNSVSGAVVFDIPKDQTPVSAELHDSSLSGGVKVSLQ